MLKKNLHLSNGDHDVAVTLAERAEILRGMSKSQQQHKWIWVIFMSEKWYSLQPEMSE